MRSPRDQWILAILPAVLLVVLYLWTYGRGLQVQVNRLGQQASAAEAARPSREALAKVPALAKPGPAVPAVQFAAPVAGLQGVTQILARQRILVVAARTADKSAGAARLGAARDLPLRIAERRNGVAPVLWSVEMIGSYEQIRAALEGIASSNLGVIPQDIAMEALGPEAPARHWTLRIWL